MKDTAHSFDWGKCKNRFILAHKKTAVYETTVFVFNNGIRYSDYSFSAFAAAITLSARFCGNSS